MALRHTLANCRQRSAGPPGGIVDVLVATKDGKLPSGLEHIPWSTRVCIDRQPGWAAAANNLLDKAAESGHDVIFIDDDVEILPKTFAKFNQYYPLADVFGFRLRGVGGIQCGWGLQKPNPFPDRACYAAHVTASLMYVRAHVLSGGVRFPVWPGTHFEDLVFTYECWYRNFAVAYVPSLALHDIRPTSDGIVIGATKRHESDLQQRRDINYRHLCQWARDHDLIQAANDGRIPYGVWGIDS